MKINKPKLFLSYAHADTKLKEIFKEQLLKNKTEIFEFDAWDDSNIETGEIWKENIFDKIKESKIGIFLISPNFLKSRFCTGRELIKFYQEKINGNAILIPILLDDCSTKDIHHLLEKIQFFKPTYSTFNLNNPNLNDKNIFLNEVVPFSRIARESNTVKKMFIDSFFQVLKLAINNYTEINKNNKKIEIEFGALLASIPNIMMNNEQTFCEIYLSYDESILDPTEAAKDGEYHYLEINQSMSIRLDAIPPERASLISHSNLTQNIPKRSQAKWSFFATPKTSKNFKLLCTAISGKDSREIDSYNEEIKVVQNLTDNIDEGNRKENTKDTMIRILNFIPIKLINSGENEEISKPNNPYYKYFLYFFSLFTLVLTGIVIIKSIWKDLPSISKDQFSIHINLFPDTYREENLEIFIQDSLNKIDTVKCINNKCISNKTYTSGELIHLNLNSKNYNPINDEFKADSVINIILKFKFIDTIFGVTKYNNNSLGNVELTIDKHINKFYSGKDGKFKIPVFLVFGGKTEFILYASKNNYYLKNENQIKFGVTKQNSNENITLTFDGIDTDGDSVLDSIDKCPTVPGRVCSEGCPDKDKDCIKDSEDICKECKGTSTFNGCNSKFQIDLLNEKEMTIYIEKDQKLINLMSCRSLKLKKPDNILVKYYNGKIVLNHEYKLDLKKLDNFELPGFKFTIDKNGQLYHNNKKIGHLNMEPCPSIERMF